MKRNVISGLALYFTLVVIAWTNCNYGSISDIVSDVNYINKKLSYIALHTTKMTHFSWFITTGHKALKMSGFFMDLAKFIDTIWDSLGHFNS